MRKTGGWLILSISVMLVLAITQAAGARSYYTWCKSFSTTDNLACSTHTDYGGTYPYTPGTAPKIYNAPDNTLFNVQYEAAGHEKAIFSMYLDSKVSTCEKGKNCDLSTDKWDTRCVWNGLDAWVCTIYYQEAQVNQYYLLGDYLARNYIYLAPSGNLNSPPLITPVPPLSFPQDAGSLANIVDLWFYTGDDRTPKQEITYTVVSQTNPGVVTCTVTANRYIDCVTQPSANGASEITFSAKDGSGATASSTFSIKITAAANPKPAPTAPEAKVVLPVPTPAAAPVSPPAENSGKPAGK